MGSHIRSSFVTVTGRGFAALGVVLLLSGLAAAVAAVGLLRRREWAREWRGFGRLCAAACAAWAAGAAVPPAYPQAASGGAEAYVTTQDGVRLYYRVVGDGPETVVVPLASYHRGTLDALARGRRLVLYDPRGRGRSDAVPPSKVSWALQVSDLDAVRRAVGADRVALVGWSDLALDVVEYAIRHPDRVTRIVQLAPAPPRRHPYEEQMLEGSRTGWIVASLQSLEAQRRAGAFDERPAEFCRALNGATWPATFADPFQAARAPDVCVFPNEWPDRLARTRRALQDALGDYDWRPRLRRVAAPRLVVAGEYDNIPLRAAREWVAGQPNARLLVVPDAGHWPHYEQPEFVLRALDAFLAGRWPAGSERVP